MNVFQRSHLDELLEPREGPCVSITLPTHREKELAPQNPIRFKRLLQDAERQLLARGLRPTDVRRWLEPAATLASPREFWDELAAGVALYLSSDWFRVFRLPLAPLELALVYGRMHVVPLVPLLEPEAEWLILAVSQNGVRLLRANRYAARDVTPAGVPGNLNEALQLEEPERTSQAHGGVQFGRGGRATVFTGQGGAPDYAKENVVEYFRTIDRALHHYLAAERVPLVFAGVDYLLPLYRQANTYRGLVEEHVSGNPDGLDSRQLHEQAWKIVAPRAEQARTDLLRRGSEETARSGPPTLDQVLTAAYGGRVAELLVADSLQCWGKFDPASGKLARYAQQQPDAEELLNVAVTETLRRGGNVHLVEQDRLPARSPLAVVYRYA